MRVLIPVFVCVLVAACSQPAPQAESADAGASAPSIRLLSEFSTRLEGETVTLDGLAERLRVREARPVSAALIRVRTETPVETVEQVEALLRAADVQMIIRTDQAPLSDVDIEIDGQC